MEISRIGMLEELLKQKEEEKRKYSHWQAGMRAEPGYEQIYEDRTSECQLLREMIREEQTRMGRRALEEFVDQYEDLLKRPDVKEALKDWQKVIMAGGTPDIGWAEEIRNE